MEFSSFSRSFLRFQRLNITPRSHKRIWKCSLKNIWYEKFLKLYPTCPLVKGHLFEHVFWKLLGPVPQHLAQVEAMVGAWAVVEGSRVRADTRRVGGGGLVVAVVHARRNWRCITTRTEIRHFEAVKAVIKQNFFWNLCEKEEHFLKPEYKHCLLRG